MLIFSSFIDNLVFKTIFYLLSFLFFISRTRANHLTPVEIKDFVTTASDSVFQRSEQCQAAVFFDSRQFSLG
ncbi:hypothetical protein THOG05_90022 [Vibrio rotiferianus]|nr:hypothetical protein THOG05_90022 [Vibrio rotiferianus]